MSTTVELLGQLEYASGELNEGVLTVVFSRPKSLNALDVGGVEQLTRLVECAGNDPTVQAIVFTGGDSKAFIAGADIKQMMGFNKGEAVKFAKNGQNLLSMIEDLPKPTIAAVNGFALGGGYRILAGMRFDLRCAESKVWLTGGWPRSHSRLGGNGAINTSGWHRAGAANGPFGTTAGSRKSYGVGLGRGNITI